MVNVKETTAYQSLTDVTVPSKKPVDLTEMLGVELEETGVEIIAEDEPFWKKHWVGMPEFIQEDKPPHKRITVSFRNQEDFEEFGKLTGQNMSNKTKSIWYPKLDKDKNTLKRWIE